ncbi:murein L,D-transpeptidase catalytic domain family protein [Rickettsiella massiliensis]|uniref:murein L,D-transpeptidase catalytic domain family protein n=1 Tax=Rickettsiella massiliensis TaxID=676517 RepID=UPI00029ACDAB|nr:murein L,D-transpeptidase catalytic domain family protein [Rickettsiella massiliensis]
MILKNKLTVLGFLLGSVFTAAVNASPSNNIGLQNTLDQFRGKTPGLSPKALQVGLEAYNKARQKGLDQKGILTIVDYTQPSTAKRLWVLDLKKDTVILNTYVAHGQNSGDNYARVFSDQSGSLTSSLGVYLTENTYSGKHGYSLRIKGLDKGFNDKAQARDIVFHSANYATAQYAAQHGRLGRSWGCFAVSPKVSGPLIQTISRGTLVVAYYPDPSWLAHSQFLA